MSDRDVLPFPSHDDGDDRDVAARLAALYEATPAADAAQVDRCVRGVLAQSMHAGTRSASGVTRPRWWWGAAAAAALVIVVAKPWRVLSTTSSATSPGADTGAASPTLAETLTAALTGSVTREGRDAVRFDLKLPTAAREVALVGDFNGWDENATPMAHQGRNGTWSAKIPLAPGRHVYAFVVDGKKWLIDPLAPTVPDDGLGPTNAVVVEGLPK